jgi:hypothetical protein
LELKNVKDLDGDPISITITKIMQDEPVNSAGSGNTTPDASGIGTSTAQIRAEIQGNADGRLYHIFYAASDSKPATDSGMCSGQFTVSVPHDQTHVALPQTSSSLLPSSSQSTQSSTKAQQQQQT